MAEVIAHAAINEVLKMSASFISNKSGLVYGADKELKKLEETLSFIRAILLDADEKKENSDLVTWVGKLNHIVYEAEDVLDLCVTKQQLRKSMNYVPEFLSKNKLLVPGAMTRKIKEIREELNEIRQNISQFHYIDKPLIEGTKVRKREKDQSFAPKSKVFGREQEKQEIIKLLHLDSHKNISTVAIVGMGGLGKTTLAQFVYGDDRVVQYFDLRIWVWISTDFDLKSLVRKIIGTTTNCNRGDLPLEVLQKLLREKLQGQKFLLFLDEIWTVNYHQWNNLKILLECGGKGSKILITTRSKKVPSIMGVTDPYCLKELSDEHCFELFTEVVFGKGPVSRQFLINDGRTKVVQKCKGVPLAVKTLGRILISEPDMDDWWSILEKEIWELEQTKDDIIPVLKLSYDNLPVYLKQCFAYCSLFPKNYKIDQSVLIKQWMAQGYLQASSSKDLQNIGNRYCKELLSRSLFEKVENNSNSDQIILHDLIYGLVQKIAESGFDGNRQRVYHLSFYFRKDMIKLPDLKLLRTLILHNSGIGSADLDSRASKYKRIRVLDLHALDIGRVPKFISELVLLRYLDLSNNNFEELPDFVCHLYNLQTLNLSNNKFLKSLPRDIKKLPNLTYLKTDGCMLLTYPPQLQN